MLRASVAVTQQHVDLTSVAGRADSGLPLDAELVSLAEAAVEPSPVALQAARERLRGAAGTAMLNDAAAVIANFEMMTRVADLTGAAVDERGQEALAPILETVGAQSFATRRWG